LIRRVDKNKKSKRSIMVKGAQETH